MLTSHSSFKYIVALSAGALFALGFAPMNFSYLTIVALSLLFYLWHHATPLRAFGCGYMFGLGAFGLGVSWVYISIHEFGGVDRYSASAITVLFVAFWALFPALLGLISVRLKVHRHVLVLAGLWVTVDYFRGVLLLNGFPWLLGAYSQLSTPLAGYIPVVGAYGTSYLLVITAALVTLVATNSRWRWQAAVVVFVIWGMGEGLTSINWTSPRGEAFQVSLIQGNIAQDQKWLAKSKLNTMLLYRQLTEAHWDSDVIIWPETAIPAFYNEVEAIFIEPLQSAAHDNGVDIIMGLPLADLEKKEIYNAVIALGEKQAIYRKDHLLPFGEYMPWQPVSGFILKQLQIGLGDFTPGGKQQALLTAAGYPFITSICYEDAFGDAGRDFLADAAFLVNVSNDAWFGNSFEPHQHLQIAAMRALESGRYMARATNTGVTAFIDPKGTIIKQAPLFTTTVLSEKIIPMQGLTPYARLGDQLIMCAILLITLLAWLLITLTNRKMHVTV
jgi:apolipoprotein N-acyltransferase